MIVGLYLLVQELRYSYLTFGESKKKKITAYFFIKILLKFRLKDGYLPHSQFSPSHVAIGVSHVDFRLTAIPHMLTKQKQSIPLIHYHKFVHVI